MLMEVSIGVVGPDVRENSAGVKGGEGQETRLFPLTWVRGPSGKLLPRSLFRQTSRWKGERIRPFPFLFCLVKKGSGLFIEFKELCLPFDRQQRAFAMQTAGVPDESL